MIDLMQPEFAYLFGLLQTDGHHSIQSRNRGKISLEISYKDKDIIFKLSNIIKVNKTIKIRERDTNFKSNYKSIVLSIYDLNFRTDMFNLGLPIGKKDSLVAIPNKPYSVPDYWRGIIDGNGSLGILKTNWPFLSLVTKSDNHKEEFINLINKITGKKKTIYRNKRDNAYNIMITKEDAQGMINFLYYKDCLAINRKIELAKQVISWIRPKDMLKRPNNIHDTVDILDILKPVYNFKAGE